MSITNIVSGQFDKFVDFANSANNADAIVKKGDVAVQADALNQKLEESSIVAKNDGDCIHKFIRGAARREVNNDIRELFRKSVADIFGGENNIPKSVQKAMKLEDYGKGRPLSARRILAVNDAIQKAKLVDSYGNESDLKNVFEVLSEDELAEAKKKISDSGLSKKDYGMINLAANRYANYFSNIPGYDLKKAMKDLLEKDSGANNFLKSGALSLKDEETFFAVLTPELGMKGKVLQAREAIEKALEADCKNNLLTAVNCYREAVGDAQKLFVLFYGQQKAFSVRDRDYKDALATFKDAIAELKSFADELGKKDGNDVEAIQKDFFGKFRNAQSYNKLAGVIGNVAQKMHKNKPADTQDVITALNTLNNSLSDLSNRPKADFRSKLADATFERFFDELADKKDVKLPQKGTKDTKGGGIVWNYEDDVIKTIYKAAIDNANDPFEILNNAKTFLKKFDPKLVQFSTEQEKQVSDAIKKAFPGIENDWRNLDVMIRTIESSYFKRALEAWLRDGEKAKEAKDNIASFVTAAKENKNLLKSFDFGFNVTGD